MRSALAPPLFLRLFLHSSPRSALSFRPSPRSQSLPLRFARRPATTRSDGRSSPAARDFPRHRRQRSPPVSNTALMSASACHTHKFIASESKILGGDHAGLSATFSSENGVLVPVPEHLVPESMVEWGEIPASLETLTSEDWIGDGDDGDADSVQGLERTTIAVLPEVGCGIDNLEVTKKVEKFDCDATRLGSWGDDLQQREVVAIDRRGQNQRLDTETIFQIDPVVDEDGESCPRRLRVSFSTELPKEGGDPALSKLITLQVDRRVSAQSTQGTAWSGPSSNSGGLDARTVMNTIGKDIVYGDVFAVKRTKGGGDPWDLSLDSGEEDDALKILEGRWTKSLISSDGDDIATIRLPQNVMVRHGRGVSDEAGAWAVEVSHLGAIVADGRTWLRRRVVARSFANDAWDGSDLGIISWGVEERPCA